MIFNIPLVRIRLPPNDNFLPMFATVRLNPGEVLVTIDIKKINFSRGDTFHSSGFCIQTPIVNLLLQKFRKD